MKKHILSYLVYVAAALPLGGVGGGLLSSCASDYLDEELTTKYSTQYFDTEEGLEALTVSLYGNIRWWFGYEHAYATTLYGTDEFTNANDLTSECWNTYDTRLSPLNATPAPSLPRLPTSSATRRCATAVWPTPTSSVATTTTD